MIIEKSPKKELKRNGVGEDSEDPEAYSPDKHQSNDNIVKPADESFSYINDEKFSN